MMTGYVRGLDVLSMLVLHFVRVWQRACGERLRPCKYDGYEWTHLKYDMGSPFYQLSPALTYIGLHPGGGALIMHIVWRSYPC